VIYQLSKTEKAIQKAASQFAKGEFDCDAARELDKKGVFPKTIWSKAAKLGFIGIHHPEKYSGGGMGYFENVLVSEAFTTRDSTLGAAIVLSYIASDWLAMFGDKNQKDDHLPGIFEGYKQTGAVSNRSNNGIENNNAYLKNTDVSDRWHLTGDIDVINGEQADILFVLCRHLDKDKPTEHSSMLILEKASQGISIKKQHSLLGLRMNGMSSIQFKNVKIDKSNFIGKPADGIFQENIFRPVFQLQMAGLALGIAQGAFDRGLSYVKGREQFGKKIADFQITRHKLAKLVIQIEQARCLTYEIAKTADSKKVDPNLAAMANLASTKTAVDVSYEAIQLLGGYGYTNEYDVERCYRDAKTLQLLSGHEHDMLDQVSAGLIGKLKKTRK